MSANTFPLEGGRVGCWGREKELKEER